MDIFFLFELLVRLIRIGAGHKFRFVPEQMS